MNVRLVSESVTFVAPHSIVNLGSRTLGPLLVIRQHACADLSYIIHIHICLADCRCICVNRARQLASIWRRFPHPPPTWRSAGAVKVKSTTGKTIALMISGQSAARLTVRYEQLLVRLASWIAIQV